MKRWLATLIPTVSTFFLATEAYAAEPGVAMMICHEVRVEGDPSTKTPFTIVAEQTNPDFQDGSVLLFDEARWSEPMPTMNTIEFTVRIFDNFSKLTDLEEPRELAIFLMSDETPVDAYQEFSDGNGRILFGTFEIRWNQDPNVLGKFKSWVMYNSEIREYDAYVDHFLDDNRNMFCSHPFLK